MSDTFLTMVIPDDEVALARTVAATMDPGGVGMWITPLSPDGQEPATAWISTGWVPEAWQQIVPVQTWTQAEDGTWTLESSTPGDPVAVTDACIAAGVEVTLAEIEALFASADVTVQDPFVAMGRLGVQMVVLGDQGQGEPITGE